jgi:hypothetical protein
MPGIRPFDARALLVPEDRAAARAFTQRLRVEGRLPPVNTAATVIVMIVLCVLLGGFGVVALVLLVVFASVLREGAVVVGILFGIPALLLIGVVVSIPFLMRRAQRTQEDRRWRLAGFAQEVGMEYVPALPDPALPGAIFHIGDARTAYDMLRAPLPRFVEVGNHSYTVSNGKTTTTSRWGYIAVRLDVPLPHIVLDAVGNGARLGSWERGQHLSLEGDFDRYFRLYCPEGYERDALYLFTPDVMARFIDNAAVLEVEIVDEWMFLVAPQELSTTDPARWAWVFSVIAALLDKLEQWGRWRDDRLSVEAPVVAQAPAPTGAFAPSGGPAPTGAPAPVAWPQPPVGVAAPGRRLRRTSPWLILGIALGILFVGGLVFTLGPLIALSFVR